MLTFIARLRRDYPDATPTELAAPALQIVRAEAALNPDRTLAGLYREATADFLSLRESGVRGTEADIIRWRLVALMNEIRHRKGLPPLAEGDGGVRARLEADAAWARAIALHEAKLVPVVG